MSIFYKSIYFCSLLLLLCGMSSCIYDDFGDFAASDSDQPMNFGYMPVYINTSGNVTRARPGDTFDAGNENEYAISDEANQWAIFYDGVNSRPAVVAPISQPSIENHGQGFSNNSIVLATIATHTDQLELIKSFKDCYIILNTDIDENTLKSKTRDELLQIQVSSPFYIDSKGRVFHTLCNSVYIENGAKKIQTFVDTNLIFNSYQEAIEEAWKGNAAVNAYLERASAKFSLSFDKEEYNAQGVNRDFEPKKNKMFVFNKINANGIPFYTSGPNPNNPNEGTYTFKVRITGWNMNALERGNYLFRNINPSGAYFSNWYDTGYKRAYWSEDINYNKAVYPFQYRRVIDNSGIPVYSTKVVKGVDSNTLLNKSFTELNANQFISKYIYTPENTYDVKDPTFNSIVDNRIEYLAGTHMIICAEVLTNLDNINEWKARDLYRDRNDNFYRSEKEVFEAMLSAMNQVLESHASLKYTYYDWTKGGVEMKLYAMTNGPCGIYLGGDRLTPQNFESVIAAHGGQLTTEAEFKGSDGKRIIWNDDLKILDSNGNPLKIYEFIDDIDPSKNRFYRNATVDDLKSLIFEHVGAVDHYKDGKMYYAVPIGYLQSTSSTDENPAYDTYGVVRNSVYEIRIKDVTGLGTPVDNVNDPIIPNGNGTNDMLYLGFKILNWHLVEESVPGAL